MSKSIYDEAVETLNKYRNQNYNSSNKDEVELANAINAILPNYVKQKKLLDLYKEALEELSWVSQTARGNYVNNIEPELTKQIKELEKELENKNDRHIESKKVNA